MKLKRTKQCAKCPWKKSVNPFDIPNGYKPEKHLALKSTIAEGGAFEPTASMRVMACHESALGEEVHCVGWLHNQLGRGNNIPLRLQMLKCENAAEIQVFGPQHPNFEGTLPDIE